MSLPGPDRCTIKKAEGGYSVEIQYRPEGRKTPVRLVKIASDEFDLKAIVKEVYG